MATDPIPPVVDPNDNTTLASSADIANQARDAFENFGHAGDVARDIMDQFTSAVGKVGISLKANQTLTQNQTAMFGLLSTSVFGARDAFKGLASDTSINTFGSQFTDLQNIMASSPAYKTAQAQLEATASFLRKMGAPTDEIQKKMAGGIKVLSAYAEAFVKSADNGLRLQNATIMLGASTGGLNDVYEAAGKNLNNINVLLAKHQESVNQTIGATGLAAEQVEEYYLQLGQVPKALATNISAGTGMNQNVSMLTAAIQLATGSGMKFSDVVDDLKIAFRDYKLTGEGALQFTARMGELSNRFGVELQDVRSALRDTAETFKMFGNNAEGAAKMMNNYLGALESTKISGHVAVDIIKNMTGAISGLSIAQKSLISSQTGGPGGLVGGFQIEQMLRQGKIDEVFEKVRQTLTQRTGRIATLEEASQSPAAAQRLEQQTLMLQSGPLGQFARTQTEAIRILESFRAKEEGKAPELAGDIVKDTMGKGVDIQQKSYSELTRIRSLIESARGTGGVANLGTIQSAFTAGTGTPIESRNTGAEMRDNLSEAMSTAAAASGTALSNQMIETGGEFAVNFLQDMEKVFGELKPAMQSGVLRVKELLGTGDVEAADREAASFRQRARQAQAGTQVGQAAGNVAGRLGTENIRVEVPTGNLTNTTATANVPKLGEITVYMEGYCLDCGEKRRSTAQSYTVNTGQKAAR